LSIVVSFRELRSVRWPLRPVRWPLRSVRWPLRSSPLARSGQSAGAHGSHDHEHRGQAWSACVARV